MKYLLLTIFTIFIFSGCSAKEFKDGTNGIVNDIGNKFNSGVDKSAK